METCEVLDFNESAKVSHSKPSSTGSSVWKKCQTRKWFRWIWFHCT